MGRKVTIVVEEADRGNVLRIVEEWEPTDGLPTAPLGRLEILEGSQGSVNLRDRTRRRLGEIAASEWPSKPDPSL